MNVQCRLSKFVRKETLEPLSTGMAAEILSMEITLYPKDFSGLSAYQIPVDGSLYTSLNSLTLAK